MSRNISSSRATRPGRDHVLRTRSATRFLFFFVLFAIFHRPLVFILPISAVEFWSGGYQLFGRCYFNRILSMDPKRFSRQLLYHSSNNKQRTLASGKFVRYTNFLGQLYTVKERALKSLMVG